MNLSKLMFLTAFWALAASAAAAQEIVLRFQHFSAPKSAAHTLFMQPWADRIEAQSGGRIKIELYGYMQLGGKASEQYDLIRDGAIDGGWIVPSRQPGRFPEAETLELPFILSKSSELASRAAWQFTQAHLLDDFSDIKLIAAHMQGRSIVHKRGDLIRTLEDFKGLRLRAPSRAAVLLLNRLGAQPVEMPAPALPNAMERNTLDGGITPWDIAPRLRMGDLVDNHLDVSGDRALGNVYYLWAMNKRTYEMLPPDLQAILDANSGLEPSAMAGRAHDKGDVIGRERMAVAGHEITRLSAPETERLRGLAQAVELDWIVDMTVLGYDGVGLLADAKRIMDDVKAE